MVQPFVLVKKVNYLFLIMIISKIKYYLKLKRIYQTNVRLKYQEMRLNSIIKYL